MARRAEVQRRFIVKYGILNRFRSILDIGCGAGLLLKVFSDHSQHAVGFETDETMASFAMNLLGPKAEVQRRYFDPYRSESRPFTLITMSHVFEHVNDPTKFLCAIREWLEPDGLVFIEVPNDPLQVVRRQVSLPVRGLAHTCFFTPESLEAIALAARFRVEKIATYGTKLRHTLRLTTRGNTPRRVLQFWTDFVRRKCDLEPAILLDLTSPLRTESSSEGQHIRMLLRLPSTD